MEPTAAEPASLAKSGFSDARKPLLVCAAKSCAMNEFNVTDLHERIERIRGLQYSSSALAGSMAQRMFQLPIRLPNAKQKRPIAAEGRQQLTTDHIPPRSKGTDSAATGSSAARLQSPLRSTAESTAALQAGDAEAVAATTVLDILWKELLGGVMCLRGVGQEQLAYEDTSPSAAGDPSGL